jgi:hypothetical protein
MVRSWEAGTAMDALFKSETLKALGDIIWVGSQSPLGYLTLATIVLAIILYVLSAKTHGLSWVGLIAYLMTIVFMLLGGVLLGYRTSAAINTVYYFGGDGHQFNVGRFLKVTDTTWNDSSLTAISTSGDDIKPSEYTFDYKLKQSRGDVLLLESTDRENVVIEIDLEQRQIYCSPCNGKRYPLYRIIAR